MNKRAKNILFLCIPVLLIVFTVGCGNLEDMEPEEEYIEDNEIRPRGSTTMGGDKADGNVTLFGIDENPGDYRDVITFGETLSLDVSKFVTPGKKHRVGIYYHITALTHFNTTDTMIKYTPPESGDYYFRIYYLNELFLCDARVEVVNENRAPVASLDITSSSDATLPTDPIHREEHSYPLDIGTDGITLDPSPSTDPENDPLTYTVAVEEYPVTKSVTVTENSGKYSFVPDRKGLYKVKLSVRDGHNEPGRENEEKVNLEQIIYIYDESAMDDFFRTTILAEEIDASGIYNVYFYPHDYIYDEWLCNSTKVEISFALYGDSTSDTLFCAFYNWSEKEEGDDLEEVATTVFIGTQEKPAEKDRNVPNKWKCDQTISQDALNAVKRIDVMCIRDDMGKNFHTNYFIKMLNTEENEIIPYGNIELIKE